MRRYMTDNKNQQYCVVNKNKNVMPNLKPVFV